jgi:hypothetical protein
MGAFFLVAESEQHPQDRCATYATYERADHSQKTDGVKNFSPRL